MRRSSSPRVGSRPSRICGSRSSRSNPLATAIRRNHMTRWPFTALVVGFLFAPHLTAPARAQPAPAQPHAPAAPPAGTMLLTVFFKHDQSQNLNEINEQLSRNGYYDKFPPAGVEVVSWYVVMGIGQIVTLRFPAERLREINVAIEQTAWGPYRTEFYPTYDYRQAAEQQRQTMRARKR